MINRFRVIRHHKGTRTLIDNQTGFRFWRENDEDVKKGIEVLIEGKATNTLKYVENKENW